MRIIRSTAARLFVATNLVAASACAHSTAASSPTTGATEPQGTAKNTSAADENFFRDAYSDASAEWSIGHMAARKGTTPQVKQLGQKLVTDSTRQLTDLKRVARKNGITLPAALEPRDQAAVSHLSRVTGQTFDRDFLKHVRVREQAVLSDMQRENKVGTNGDLKSYAGSELATVRSQIDQARGIGVTAPQKGVTAPQKKGPTAP